MAAQRAVERIVALLSSEQKSKWQELIGPPFPYDLPPLRR
jgi:hypothetical protein